MTRAAHTYEEGTATAGRAAELGAKVLVLEKMRTEGRKLLITGKGRCNVSNSAPISDFISHVFPNGRFLKNAFSQYFSEDILELLKRYNVDITLERGGRYFPTSQKAKDILDALLNWMNDLGVEIQCGFRVEKLLVDPKFDPKCFQQNVSICFKNKSESTSSRKCEIHLPKLPEPWAQPELNWLACKPEINCKSR